MKILSFLSSIIFTVLLVGPASAEELNYNLVNLNAGAEKQVDNDILVVTMAASADTDSAKKAAQIVNQHMAWGLEQLASTPSIKTQSMNYQTRPRYKNKTIIGWSGKDVRKRSLETCLGAVIFHEWTMSRTG